MTRYLLGSLSDEERASLEERYFSDDAMFEEIEIAEEELIDRYVRGELSKGDSERFAAVVAESPRLAERVEFARVWKAKLSGSVARLEPVQKTIEPKKGWGKGAQPISVSMRYLAIAASVVVVIGVGFFGYRTFIYEPPIERGLEALQAAYREQRPVETRLSGFNYAPLATQRGAPTRVDYVQRDLATSLLTSEAINHPSPTSLHALGQYYLMERKFDLAIDQFQKALAIDPNNPKIHSDMGAALFEEGKRLDGSPQGKGVQLLAESLAHLNKTLQINPTSLEALFNRALVQEGLGLLVQAEADWRRYLELDPNSKWADDARQNLKNVEDKKKQTSQSNEEIFNDFVRSYESQDTEASWRLVSNYHNRTGNIVAEGLLQRFLKSNEENRKDEAQRYLKLLSYVGEIEKQRAGDHFFSDLAAFYESANHKQLDAAKRARALMKESYDGWGDFTIEKNLSLFLKAKELLEAAGAFGEAQVAQYWIAFCYFRLQSQDETKQILEPLLLLCANRRYLSLQVRGLYLRSAIEFDLNEHSRAIDFALQCFELAQQTNDQIGLLNAASSLIEYYRYLGDYPKALSHIQSSVPLVSSISLDPIQGTRHFSTVASLFATIGLFVAANGYQSEAMRLATKTGKTATLIYNYAYLGEIQGKMGDTEEGLRNVRLAYEMTKSNAIDSSSQTSLAFFSLQMGDIYRETGDFGAAVTNYSRAIELFENSTLSSYLYKAHKGRLLCYVAVKNDELAKQEMSTTLSLAEKYRTQIKEEHNRNTFFDVEQSLYDVAVDFAFSRLNDSEQALNYLELARARSLLDLLKADSEVLAKISEPQLIIHNVTHPRKLAEIRRDLPEGAQILQYAVLEDKLLIWVMSRSSTTVVAKGINKKDLSERVGRYLELVSSPASNEDQARIESQLAKELFTILITPVEPLLGKDQQICIIPDKILEYVPFAALISPVSEKYLMEDYAILRSPSPSVFMVATEAAKKRKAIPESVLSVGNPQFDKALFPDLSELPAARSEAMRSAAFYNGAVTLIDDDATTDAVKRNMLRASVIHLALHSALDTDAPLRSRLVLAKNAASKTQPSDSVLYAYEIYNSNLSQARLVVLSACQTGAERYYGGEGTASLARAFLAAGTPLVVASLWPVDSIATEQLMVGLHQRRAGNGISTVDAIRKAQLDLLKNPDARFRRPYYWAAFTVMGGYSTF